jgi:hypothetical protein
VSRLAAAIHARGTVSVDRRVEGAAGDNARLRPDIVVRDEESRRITIVDVAVPFENGAAAFDEAREEKIRKYHSLAEDLRGAGYVVEVAAFLVGALGSWDPRNEWAMGLLGVNGYYATWRGCASSDFAKAHPPKGDTHQCNQMHIDRDTYIIPK